jgi:hypothetical protein
VLYNEDYVNRELSLLFNYLDCYEKVANDLPVSQRGERAQFVVHAIGLHLLSTLMRSHPHILACLFMHIKKNSE